MLDLSRPLGQVDGLVLYADHQDRTLVYYLPDEVDLRQLLPDTPDLGLQIFFPDDAVVGDAADLSKATGAILSLGVGCTLSPSRRELVRSTLADQLGTEVRLSAPPWEDGSVQLLLLDSQSGGPAAPGRQDDPLVLGVVGSRKPSLSDGQLTCLFHARLDHRGAALAAAALQGQAGTLGGVLYELSFAALRPTVDLRMSADLNRCAEYFTSGVGVQVYYVSADVQATFAKMREKGDIKVDLVSQASDPESERLVNECVKDFYDVLMRELFRPTVSPAEAVGAGGLGGGGASSSTSIVRLSFAYTRVDHERRVEVDYRKRSATRRLHNPQAHLGRLASLGGGAQRVIQRVPLSAAWRQFEVEVAAPAAFDDPTLRQVAVVLWRGRDPVLPAEQARDGGLRMPASAAPLAELAFSRDDARPRRLSFVTQAGEPPFYRWQARCTYAQHPDIDSPAEIWSEPHQSSSSDLDLFPDILAPRLQALLKLSTGQNREPRSIEAQLLVRAAGGEVLAERRLTVDASRPDAGWSVRRGEAARLRLEAALVYRYPDSATLSLPRQTLIDREIMANDPFGRAVTLTPLVVGAPADLLEVVFVARYQDLATGYLQEVVRQLRPPELRTQDLSIPVVRSDDQVSWQATAVHTDGQTRPLGHGQSAGGTIVLRFSNTRRLRVEWLGPPPADLRLRWLRATFRARRDDGEVLATQVVEWRGGAVEGERVVTLPMEGRAEWMIQKLFEDGRKESVPFSPVDSDLLAVQG
jgi:hypothetical protein